MIRATDPSGASDIGTVPVNIMDVNEAPAFTDGTKGQTTLYMEEGTDDSAPGLFTDMGLDPGDAVDPYVADGPGW